MQMKPNFMKPASYSPYTRTARTANTEDERTLRRIVQAELARHGEALHALACGVRDLEVLRVSANRTGNKVDIRARVSGRSVTFHVCTEELSNSRPRTRDMLAAECLEQLAGKIDPKGKPAKNVDKLLIEAFAKNVSEEAKSRCTGWVHFWRRDSEAEIVDHILADTPDVGPGLDRLFAAYQKFMAEGGVDANRNAHQTSRALDAVRNAADHAFKHGCDIETIITAVRETLVKDVLES